MGIDRLFACPISRQPLVTMPPERLVALNDEIRQGERVHADGSKLKGEPLTFALATADGRYVYRVEDDIYCLLPGLAIVAPSDATIGALDQDKQVVQSFYDEFGWVKAEDGLYKDTLAFTDIDLVAREYSAACDKRVQTQLRSGDYLLDAASGAIPMASYIPFSENYKKRVCVDFSIRALREARTKLGPDRGIYVLGDITCLPIAEGVIDDAISLHTIYHVPKDQQSQAVDELVRTLKPGGRLVIVYTWGTSPLMTVARELAAFIGWIKRAIRRRPKTNAWAGGPAAPPLYFHAQGKDWYRSLKAKYNVKLKVWSATDISFHRSYFKNGRFGKLMSALVLTAENVAGPIFARYGQYPLFLIAKAQ